MERDWSPVSWKRKKALYQPKYRNNQRYVEILKQIRGYPPSVFPGEVENLKKQIAEAGEGKRFILHGGDCAERFSDCTEQAITNKLKILLQMSIVLTHALRKPVLRIGRISGQFAKPRSNITETVDSQTIPTYMGDSINSFEPDLEAREPDPERLLKGFYLSAISLNYIRAMIDGGFADLHHPYNWNLDSIERTKKWDQYRDIIEHIMDAIHFMETFGGLNSDRLGRIEFFTSHEGLHLDYEATLTRKDQSNGEFYNLGAHMLWIGERTRASNGAHVEYFRGIANPIGIKIGPTVTTDALLKLLDILNPHNERGRITLITRLGVKKVRDLLPRLILAIDSGRHVTWSCDPMHGNTIITRENLKTRKFSDILEEFEQSFLIHEDNGSTLAGVHFELTGEPVTECTGGAVELKDRDLHKNYQTYCDPRLNYTQSMEIAFLISKLFKKM